MAAPAAGPNTGIQAYPQSEVPLFLMGKIACMIRGPKSRAGLMAYPVVPPNPNPIPHTKIPTKKGPRPCSTLEKVPKATTAKAEAKASDGRICTK